ncbi:MAG: sensor histidine kinase [Hyphomonadaceae bacterium]
MAKIARRVAEREGRGEADVHVEVAESLRAVAEPELLSRALGNLVRNAIRYAGAAGPITIIGEEMGGRVLVTVADSGPGVPADALVRIFDPFFRIDPARARETGGAGLGLAIVKTCVDSCRGRVTAQNQAKGGLAVTISLEKVEASIRALLSETAG